VKEAGLQTPELSNILEHESAKRTHEVLHKRQGAVGEQAHLCEALVKPLTNKRLCVDAAGLGGRISGLPGEISRLRVSKGEVSSGHSSCLETSRKHYGGLTWQ
jgi:hypothetical protein